MLTVAWVLVAFLSLPVVLFLIWRHTRLHWAWKALASFSYALVWFGYLFVSW